MDDWGYAHLIVAVFWIFVLVMGTCVVGIVIEVAKAGKRTRF
jgi:hypothetical protein